HATPPRRRAEKLGAALAEQREDGHQGGAALLYVLPPLRVPHRPCRLQPCTPGGRGRVLRGLAGGAAALPAACGGVVRSRTRPVGAVLRSRGGGLRNAPKARDRALRRRGPDALLLPRPAVPGAARERRLRADARFALHIKGAGEAAAERRRARPAGGRVAPQLGA